MKKITLLIILFIVTIAVNAQEETANVKKGFIIIHASKDYNLAKRVATEANKHLEYNVNYRDLEYNKMLGLSMPKDSCEKFGFEFPTYIQRGREKDGNFISVEYTNAYNNFTQGYYIVVVASYEKGNNKLKETLKFVKQHYETAYIKYTDIYMGCIH